MECNYHSGTGGYSLMKAAEDALRRSPYTAVRNLSCHCDQGVLFLRGQVPSFYQKQMAQTAVARLPGVVEVVNLAEVVTFATARE